MNFIATKRADLIKLINIKAVKLDQLTPHWRDDKELLLAVAVVDYMVFEFASARLQGNAEFVYELIIVRGCCINLLGYVARELADNFEFIKIILVAYREPITRVARWRNGATGFMEFVGDRLKANAEIIVLIYSKIKTCYSRELTPEILADRSNALKIMRANGRLLHILSAEFKDDYDIVLASVRSHRFSLFDASARLGADKNIVLAAVRKEALLFGKRFGRTALLEIDKKFQLDSDVAKVAIMGEPRWFLKNKITTKFDFSTWLQDKEFVVELLTKKRGEAFEFIGAQWRDDPEVAHLAVMRNSDNVHFVSRRLKCSAHFAFLAVSLFRIRRSNALESARANCSLGGNLRGARVGDVKRRWRRMMSAIDKSIRPVGYRSADMLVCFRLMERVR